MRRLAVGGIPILMIVALLGGSGNAHELPECGGATIESFAHTYNPPDSWPQGMKDAVDLSAQNMTNNSQYNWTKVTSNADAPWANLNSSDTSIAGRTTFTYWCSTSPKKLEIVASEKPFLRRSTY